MSRRRLGHAAVPNQHLQRGQHGRRPRRPAPLHTADPGLFPPGQPAAQDALRPAGMDAGSLAADPEALTKLMGGSSGMNEWQHKNRDSI